MNSGKMLRDAYTRAMKYAQERNRGLDIYFTINGIQFRLHDCAGSDQIDTFNWQQLEEVGRTEQIADGFVQMVEQLDAKLRVHGK